MAADPYSGSDPGGRSVFCLLDVLSDTTVGTFGRHGFPWEKGYMIDLDVDEDDLSINAIHERGQVVGDSQATSGETHAVLWTK